MDILVERLSETYETSLNNGNHPKEWRRAIGAIIPKPKKQDYTSVKSYRPVSLLSTLGKGLEKIVSERITKVVEESRTKGLHRTQWGGRKGRSAEECVEVTLQWAKEKEEGGKKVILIMTDVAHVFLNVTKERLANRITEMKAPEQLAKWTTSFMSEREVKLRFDGEEGKWEPVETGIP